VTFAPDLLGSGERMYPGRRHFDNEPFYEKHPRWSGTGKDLWDMGRALDVMESMPEVDRVRIGSIGPLPGRRHHLLPHAVDARVRVGVSNCGLWPHRLAKNPFCVARTGWWIGRPCPEPALPLRKNPRRSTSMTLRPRRAAPFLNISSLAEYGYTAADEPSHQPAWETWPAT